MFVEPEANETKTAIKTDPSAPARSAIRRHRTVRYNVRQRRANNADTLTRGVQQRRMLREFIRHRDRTRGSNARYDQREAEQMLFAAEQYVFSE